MNRAAAQRNMSPGLARANVQMRVSRKGAIIYRLPGRKGAPEEREATGRQKSKNSLKTPRQMTRIARERQTDEGARPPQKRRATSPHRAFRLKPESSNAA